MNKLELKIVLAAVEKITAPLRRVRESGVATGAALLETRNSIKSLEKQLGHIDGYRATGRQLGITGRELVKAQENVKRLALEMQASERPSKALTKEFEQARASTVRLITQQKALTQRYREQKQALQSAGIDTKQLSAHQKQLTEQLGQANTKLAQQKQQLADVAAQQRKLNDIRQTYDKTLNLRNNLAGTGATMIASGAATAAVGAKPVIEFAKAETAATDLKISMMGAGGQVRAEFKAINELATKLGNKLPGTTADFQNMMTTLVQQGMSAKAILGSLGEATAYLGVQMKLPFDAAAEFAAKLQDATGTAEKDMMGLMDVIQRSYYLGVGQDNMLQAFSKLSSALPILRKSGLEAAKVLSPLVVMADQAGMAGEAAGNAYRKAFQASMNTGKVTAANKTLKEYGVQLNFTDGKGEFAGLQTMFGELAKLQKLNTETRLQILKDIYGDDAETLQVLNLMITKGIDGYRETQAKMKAQADLQTRVNEQLGTLTNLWDSAAGTFTNAMVLFGEAIAPELKAITVWLADMSEALGNWAKENPALASVLMKTIALVAGVTITLGALALGLSAVLGPFALLRKTLSVLGVTGLPVVSKALTVARIAVLGFGKALLLSPITWILAGIAAVATGIYLVIKHWDVVKSWLDEFWSWITQLWNAGTEQMIGVFNSLPGPIQEVLKTLWEMFKTVFDWTPLGIIVNNFDAIVAFFQTLPAKFKSLGEMTIDGLLSGITSRLTDLKKTLTGAAESTIGWFKDTLGIQSPSKVFAALGHDTIHGYQIGVEKQSKDTASPFTASARQQPAPVASNRQITVDASLQAPITIHAAPGMNTQDIARAVAIELDKRERAQKARIRASLRDTE